MFYVYILRCEDNSLYTGYTTDMEKRWSEHVRKTGAKYTRSHTVKCLEALWSTETRHDALSAEYHIKKLTKANKEYLIQCPDKLGEVLSGKIENYKVMDKYVFKN